jgi:signal transduction histidine kinase
MVRFEIVLAPDLPPCIAGPAHFQSAVLNLVINPRDAMLKGGALSVSTSAGTLTASDLTGNSDAKPGRFVSVCIRDTGVGMSADVLARVFEPFFTTRQAGGGTGPGLSQAYGFAGQSGGHIVRLSAPNVGTEALLWLPVAVAPAAAMDSMERRTDAAATLARPAIGGQVSIDSEPNSIGQHTGKSP